MKQLYRDIIDRIKSEIPEILHVNTWNNQVDEMLMDEGNKTFPIDFPACWVEIESPSEITQLGAGVQLYDPLYISFHIVTTTFNSYEYPDYNSIDMYLDWDVLGKKMYETMQLYEFNGCVAFVRVEAGQDTQHGNLYHHTVRFVTNYMSSEMKKPVGGQDYSGADFIINKIIDKLNG